MFVVVCACMYTPAHSHALSRRTQSKEVKMFLLFLIHYCFPKVTSKEMISVSASMKARICLCTCTDLCVYV